MTAKESANRISVLTDEEMAPGEFFPPDQEFDWRGEPVTEAHFAELLRRECGGRCYLAGQKAEIVAWGDRVLKVHRES